MHTDGWSEAGTWIVCITGAFRVPLRSTLGCVLEGGAVQDVWIMPRHDAPDMGIVDSGLADLSGEIRSATTMKIRLAVGAETMSCRSAFAPMGHQLDGLLPGLHRNPFTGLGKFYNPMAGTGI